MSTKRSWIVLLFMALMTTLSQFDKNAIAVAAVPISQEFGFSTTEMGFVISCFFISYTVMNIFGGYIADIYGARKVAIVVTVLWSLFTGITGIAWSFASLLAIRFTFGAAEGAFPPTNSLLVAELFSPEKRAFPKSFITGSSAAGIGFGAIAITYITHHFGWRNAFYIYCMVGFLLSAMFYWASKDMKRPVREGSSQKQRISYKEVLKVPLIWKILPLQFAGGAFMWGLNSWLPSYWMNVKGLKLVAMGVAAAIPNIISALSIMCMGYFLDKYLAGKEKRVIASTAAISGIFTYLTFTAPSVTLGVTYMTVASVCAGILIQTNLICVIKYFPQHTIGAGAGMGNGASQLAGIITPALMGYILSITNGNYTAVFGSVIFMLFIAFLIALTLDTSKEAAQFTANKSMQSK